jgi:hypothetical protein
MTIDPNEAFQTDKERLIDLKDQLATARQQYQYSSFKSGARWRRRIGDIEAEIKEVEARLSVEGAL